ncbi:DUF2442 domain-containing protein [Brevundimonas sp. AJA228-03]|uniref:DUF2442 domain-containing protein n=1 Tax=Brevundimonas sp. AJA228-03 TaxID=2752515 RepID=UPI001ADF7B57|nr:DUF2442 domain-containing protein [Brevundimonas sp. AJA228-03]QTN20784.1 DUF2442 domain-containing protein [Brevundimonas sp. AJA228-03]
MSDEQSHIIRSVRAAEDYTLLLVWEQGEEVKIDLATTIRSQPFKALADLNAFRQVELGDWGHSVVWPGEIEMGADSLWLDSLTAWGRDDTRAFLEWRLRNGLSLNGAAEALGLSRRTIAYYSGGRPVPRSILLACKGWDALKAA